HAPDHPFLFATNIPDEGELLQLHQPLLDEPGDGAAVRQHVACSELVQRGQHRRATDGVGAPGVAALAVVEAAHHVGWPDRPGHRANWGLRAAIARWYGPGSNGPCGRSKSSHSVMMNEMKRTRGSRSRSVSLPVTAPASPFLPGKPNRVATTMSRLRSRASDA